MGPVVSSDRITSRNGPRKVFTSISLRSVTNERETIHYFNVCPGLLLIFIFDLTLHVSAWAFLAFVSLGVGQKVPPYVSPKVFML